MNQTGASSIRRQPSIVLLPLFASVLIAGLLNFDLLWRLDNVLYDVGLRLSTSEAPTDIVLIAIDEASLDQLGRWPWPRRLHAKLIRELTAAGAKAIGYDVIFAEPDPHDAAGDLDLASAVRASKRVVLPVLAEQAHIGAPLVETLPLPALTEAAASLGHVHFELDADGIARSVYLYEGLGKPHWPHFSLALAKMSGYNPIAPAKMQTTSPYVWTRSQSRLIPFAGEAGTFAHLSFGRVVTGKFDPELIKDKIVLVGVTATGLGDALPTPMSALSQPMPGIEVNANVLSAIRSQTLIEPTDLKTRLLFSLFFVLTPLLFFAFLSPRATLAFTVAAMLVALAVSFLLLSVSRLWLPPVAILLTLSLCYPIWSWRRLETAMSYLDAELARMNREPRRVESTVDLDGTTTSYLRRVHKITQMAVYDAQKRQLLSLMPTDQNDARPLSPPPSLQRNQWARLGNEMWHLFEKNDQTYAFGIVVNQPPTAATLDTIKKSVSDSLNSERDRPRGSIELLQSRIELVQNATDQLIRLREFLSASLSQLPDGILIADALGRIVLANQLASTLFNDTELARSDLLDRLEQCSESQENGWVETLGRVITNSEPAQRQGVAPNGRDVFIHLSPLSVTGAHQFGIIATFSDVTELKQSERRRSELLSFISHDLRAPLVSILAVVDLAKNDHDAPAAPWLARVKRYGEQTLELAQQFVELSRVESRESLTFREVNLVDVCANAADQIWAQAQAKDIVIQQVPCSHTLWVHGDAQMLQRAIVNLLGNAIKFSRENSAIVVIIEKIGDMAHCAVKDTGCGIADEDMSSIFERFRRLTNRESVASHGVGLGLAFVKAVASSHGGDISVESKLGSGSTFRLTLPVSAHTASVV